MDNDSMFDNKEFIENPHLKRMENSDGASSNGYQLRIHGKLHFVKEIKPELKNDSRVRAAFRKENELGYSLSHPGLPKYVFIEGIYSPEEYVVTEWIDGLTLDQFLEFNPTYFSKRKNLERFLQEMADIIDYLHLQGIIHSDIKPSNIILTRNGGHAILIDLGFASSASHDLTTGLSEEFAAPEVLQGERNNSSDYYSLGKVLQYIRENSDSGLSHSFLKIEKALKSPESNFRLQTKSEIEYLFSRKRKSVYLGLGIVAVSILIGLSFIGITSKNKTIVNGFRDEIKMNINDNYSKALNLIDSLESTDNYSYDGLRIILQASQEAREEIDDFGYYKERYPNIPIDTIEIIVRAEFAIFFEKEWLPRQTGYYDKIRKD